MRIEIDQSPRIEETNRSSVLAFSNRLSYTIFVSAKVKRQVFKLLRLLGQSSIASKITFFSILVFILLEPFLPQLDQVLIDWEYPGHEFQIKSRLLQLSKKFKKQLKSEQIGFKQIGKKSKAHELAWTRFRKKAPVNKVVSFEEIERYLYAYEKTLGESF